MIRGAFAPVPTRNKMTGKTPDIREARRSTGSFGPLQQLALVICGTFIFTTLGHSASLSQDYAQAISAFAYNDESAEQSRGGNFSFDYGASHGEVTTRLPRINGFGQTESADWQRQIDMGVRFAPSDAFRLGVTGRMFEVRNPLSSRQLGLDIGAIEDWEENSVANFGLYAALFGDRVSYQMGVARSSTETLGEREPNENAKLPVSLQEEDVDDDTLDGRGNAQWHRLDLSLFESDSLKAGSFIYYRSVDATFYSVQDSFDPNFSKKGETWNLGSEFELGSTRVSAFWNDYSLLKQNKVKAEKSQGGKLQFDGVALSFFVNDASDIDLEENGDRDTEIIHEVGGGIDFGLVALHISKSKSTQTFDYSDGLWEIEGRSVTTGMSFDIDEYRGSGGNGFTARGLLPSSISLSLEQGDFALSWAPDSPVDSETTYSLGLYWDWSGKGDTDLSFERTFYESNEIGMETADEISHTVDFSQSVYSANWDARGHLSYTDYRYTLTGERSFDSSLGGGVAFKLRPDRLPSFGISLYTDVTKSASVDFEYDSRSVGWGYNASIDFTRYLGQLVHPEREPYLRFNYHFESDRKSSLLSGSEADRGHAATMKFGLRF